MVGQGQSEGCHGHLGVWSQEVVQNMLCLNTLFWAISHMIPWYYRYPHLAPFEGYGDGIPWIEGVFGGSKTGSIWGQNGYLGCWSEEVIRTWSEHGPNHVLF